MVSLFNLPLITQLASVLSIPTTKKKYLRNIQTIIEEKKFIRQSKQDKWITMVTLSARLTVLCKDTLNGLLLMTESSIDFLVH